MKLSLTSMVVAIGIVTSADTTFGQTHGHLNVGAVGINQGDQLTFDNGPIFQTNTGYIMTLTYTNGGTYGGYYQGNITLTALAATPAFGGPVPNAPALGSQIYAQIVSVDGPAGGAFGFWDAGATNPTISLACGTTGTNAYILSQNDGSPGSDPYGHIHGRRFTATKPGIYLVSFRAVDRSTNGANGGPIHSPSEVLKFYFQAGINIASVAPADGTAAVTFGAAANSTYYLEYATNLSVGGWSSAASTSGNDALQTLIDETATDTERFYRIRVTTP
ncbi:MAG: hypothetical protein JWR69_3074 [Pedosphaera sp.]|nr:hypothetical protein [Pedosphaera sp.]